MHFKAQSGAGHLTGAEMFFCSCLWHKWEQEPAPPSVFLSLGAVPNLLVRYPVASLVCNSNLPGLLDPLRRDRPSLKGSHLFYFAHFMIENYKVVDILRKCEGLPRVTSQAHYAKTWIHVSVFHFCFWFGVEMARKTCDLTNQSHWQVMLQNESRSPYLYLVSILLLVIVLVL